MSNKEVIRLEDISVAYDNEKVLNNINLSIMDKEFVTFLGPSGCGKTTTLRIIGGFVRPEKGNVYFDGHLINNLPPYKRNVNTVFQKYSLFEHLNVHDNVAFGLQIKKMPREEINELVMQMLHLVNLDGFEKRDVVSLSGGQQQRVAIARALINSPRVLLLDEPLGALDLQLRKELQVELKRIQKTTGITFVYVTHDQEEALALSDRIVVMNRGIIQQIGTPMEVYNEPKNAFVAYFIGESNILDGHMREDELVSFLGQEFDCVDKGFDTNEKVDVVVRPEDIQITSPELGMLIGVVEDITFMGMHYWIKVNSGCFQWKIRSTVAQSVGSEVGINIEPDSIHIMKRSSDLVPEVLCVEE